MRTPNFLAAFFCALALGAAPMPAAGQACTDSNGTFRFLNDEFPPLSTNGPVFVGQLVVANADGPVTFSVDPAKDPLPAGLTLDPLSGIITGLPESSSNSTVRFKADDTTQSITRDVVFSINSSGGGGNGGSGLETPVFPDGTVGTAYPTQTLTPTGVGPHTFGASGLPPGLTLNGQTGEVSGTPTAAGTFFATFTLYDFTPTEENLGTLVVPIVIHPDGSTFEFSTQTLNNGEVGTPYCDQYAVVDAAGVVTFGASGLPEGLTLDPATGAVTGTPTVAGSFLVTITANDTVDTISTNLTMVIAASSTSDFHWNFLGLPAAFANVPYDDGNPPPSRLTAEGGDSNPVYSATGLPPGIVYDENTGELSGTAVDQGEYPVTFMADDGLDVITLNLTFIVLPTTGGDVSQIIVNFWVTKAALKLGEDGRESWAVSAIYNADRRTGTRYDPATDAFQALLGAHVLDIEAGECLGDDQSCGYKSPKEELPKVAAKFAPDKQVLVWKTSSDTINESVPGVLSQTVKLGDRAWRVLMSFDEKGSFRPALAFERTVFVLQKGALSMKAPGSDSVKLGLLLADPNLGYDPGVSTLRFRLLDGDTVLVDRDFTALGDVPKVGVDKNSGKPYITFKALKDEAETDVVKFAYAGAKGAIKLDVSNTDLTGITDGEAYLTIELTIGSRIYSTNVTFFGNVGSKYGLSIP